MAIKVGIFREIRHRHVLTVTLCSLLVPLGAANVPPSKGLPLEPLKLVSQSHHGSENNIRFSERTDGELNRHYKVSQSGFGRGINSITGSQLYVVPVASYSVLSPTHEN